MAVTVDIEAVKRRLIEEREGIVEERRRLAEDTSRDAEDRQVARWREMSPTEKLTLVAELTSAVDRLALAGIRQRYPDA